MKTETISGKKHDPFAWSIRMTLVFKPETEAKLCAFVAEHGGDVHAVADSLLADALEYAEAEFEETMAGIDAGWRACEEGRCRPFSEYVAERAVLDRLTRITEVGPDGTIRLGDALREHYKMHPGARVVVGATKNGVMLVPAGSSPYEDLEQQLVAGESEDGNNHSR
jgi:hypothetical protein